MENVSPENLEVFSGLVVKAVQGGHWAALVALCIVAAVWGIRKYLGPKFPALATGRGGAILNLVGSFGSGLVVAATGAPFSWAMVLSLALSLFTAGGWSLISSLIFGRGDAADSEAKAKAAGLAAANAVAGKPPTSDSIANGP